MPEPRNGRRAGENPIPRTLEEECAIALAAYEGNAWEDCVSWRQKDYRQAARVVLVTVSNRLLAGTDG